MPWTTYKLYRHLQSVGPEGKWYCDADGDWEVDTDSDVEAYVSSNYEPTSPDSYETSDNSDDDFRSLYGFSLC